MKLFYNFLNSINGIKIALKENSFILEIVGGLFLVPYVIFIDISFSMKLIIIAVYFLLLAFEIINTSIEKLCNKITREIDNEIKEIKDLSSASVFIILAILVVLILFTFL